LRLPAYKTKTVCTIGPTSRSEALLERLMLQGRPKRSLSLRKPVNTHGKISGRYHG